MNNIKETEITLLFPGRHILHTHFQMKYLQQVLSTPLENLPIVGNPPIPKNARIATVMFAITSANKCNSRYNPLPLMWRSIGVDRFFEAFRNKEDYNLQEMIVEIPHVDPTTKYFDIMLKDIEEETAMELKPENTIVLTSTLDLISKCQEAGFGVLTAEININTQEYNEVTPGHVVKHLGECPNWQKDEKLKTMVAPRTWRFWNENPIVPETIQRVWGEPLLTDSGSLTETRNYGSYAQGMNQGFLLDIKFQEILPGIVPGKIVDEGCSDGGLLAKIGLAFPDSDLIGIEITPEFISRCKERQRAGDFRDSFVFFHQKNLMNPVFKPASINTTICNSTVHEIWSYGEGLKSLHQYLNHKYIQTKKGGRLLIRDVVGPENHDEEIYLWLNELDGENDLSQPLPQDPEKLSLFLENLSTKSRFYLFAEHYLADMRKTGRRGEDTKIRFREETIGDKNYVVLKLKDACEFITKKDYTDNFFSELNEEFCFFSFSDWKSVLKEHGFSVLENPNDLKHSSRSYTSEWIVENRYKGSVELYTMSSDGLILLEYPVTNMVLIAEKQ